MSRGFLPRRKGCAICVISTIIAAAATVRVLAFPVRLPLYVTTQRAAVIAAAVRASLLCLTTSTPAVGILSAASRYSHS